MKLDPAFYVQRVYKQFIENLKEEEKIDFMPQDIINEVIDIGENYSKIQDYTIKAAIETFNISGLNLLNISIDSP